MKELKRKAPRVKGEWSPALEISAIFRRELMVEESLSLRFLAKLYTLFGIVILTRTVFSDGFLYGLVGIIVSKNIKF
ncbi:MAG: hypothetical protein KKF44_08850, partial [Nanoarchaeota archaeon]|nr:hypothetical protein [Nanoarchaeota archaeon]